MTDEEALKEIDRQEKRFAAAGCGRGLRLAKSARECYEAMVELHQEAVDAEAGCLAAKRKAAMMVGAAGFEPTTTCAQGRCATRLRYAPFERTV